MRGIARIDLGRIATSMTCGRLSRLSSSSGSESTPASYLNYAENLAHFEPLAASAELLEPRSTSRVDVA